MSDLSEAVRYIEEYVTKETSSLEQTISNVNISSFNNPLGSIENNQLGSTLSNVQKSFAGNPVIKAIGDTAIQMATTTLQSMVRDVFKHNNLNPIQDATQALFQGLATIATIDSELAMELTRNTARNLTVVLQRKQALSDGMKQDMVKIHNACVIILNSTPFIDQYVKDLLAAYSILEQAERSFESVYQGLDSDTNPVFKTNTFNTGVSRLESAQALILPDRGNVTSDAITFFDFLDQTQNRATNKQAIAAAQAIPNLSQALVSKSLGYVAAVYEANSLINVYLNAVDEYIKAFKKNKNLYQASKDHVSIGQQKLQSLIVNMESVLQPSQQLNPQYNPAQQLTYGPKVMASATAWGITLQAIIEWMKLNPGVGAAQIDKTSRSVEAYTESVALIEQMGNISYVGGVYLCSNGKEEPLQIVPKIARLIRKVNLVIATSTTRDQLATEFRIVTNYLNASTQNTNRLIGALNIFTSTKPNLPTAAKKALDEVLDFANKYKLDRLAGLINNGDIEKIFASTPDTATYSGAAVVGMNNVIEQVSSSSTATDQNLQKLTNARDVQSRTQKTEEIESNRLFSSSIAAVRESVNKRIASLKETLTHTIEAARGLDPASQSPPDQAAEALSSVTPGFNVNAGLAGVKSKFIDVVASTDIKL
jgi:hypothetical protein